MPETRTITVFGRDLATELLPGALQGNVGDGGTTFVDESREIDKNFTVGDFSVDPSGNVQIKAGTLKSADTIAPFGADNKVSPPADQRIAYIEVDLGADVSANATFTQGIASLDVTLGSNNTTSYARYILVAPTDTKLEAADKLITNIALPRRKALSDFQNEIIAYAYKLSFDLDLALTVGYNKTVSETLKYIDTWVGEEVPFTAEIAAELKGSAGIALTNNVNVAVGTIWDKPGWVRLRVSRSHEDAMSLAAELNLTISYTLGDSLTTILDKILELKPVKELLDAVTAVNQALAGIENVTLAQLKSKVDTKVVSFLDKKLGISNFIDTNADLARFVDYANQLVTAYNDIPTRLETLWNKLLVKANLGTDSEIRQILSKIVGLDTSSATAFFTQVFGQDFTEAVDMLETILDDNLEALVTSAWDKVKPDIDKAISYAKQAENFLENAPQEVADKIYAYAKKSGAAGVIEWLNTNATSLAQVQAFTNTEMQKVVAKVTGKVFDKIDENAFEKLQGWLKDMSAKLDKVEDFDTELKAKLAKLNGEVGANLTMELERTLTHEALLDIDLKVDNTAVQDAWAVSKGTNLRKLLKALPLDKDADNNDNLPYQIRECAFTTTRVRTSAWGAVLSGLFDFKKDTSSVCTSSASVTATQVGDNLERTGSFSGGLVRSISIENDFSWNGGFNLICNATDSGNPDITAPFDQLDYMFRLTSERTDQHTTQTEIAAMGRLLQSLGFMKGAESIPEGFEEGCISKLAIKLELWGDMAEAFCQAGGWTETNATDSVYLPAGRNWIKYGLDQTTNPAIADALLAFMATPPYTRLFPGNAETLNNMNFPLPGTPNGVRNLKQVPAFAAVKLSEAAVNDAESFNKVQALPTSGTRMEMFKLMGRFAVACKKANVTVWPSPLFIYWLVRERLEKLGKYQPNQVRGLASLRFMQSDGSELGAKLWPLT